MPTSTKEYLEISDSSDKEKHKEKDSNIATPMQIDSQQESSVTNQQPITNQQSVANQQPQLSTTTTPEANASHTQDNNSNNIDNDNHNVAKSSEEQRENEVSGMSEVREPAASQDRMEVDSVVKTEVQGEQTSSKVSKQSNVIYCNSSLFVLLRLIQVHSFIRF